MISEAIKKIVGKQDLTYEEAFQVMNEIMDGSTSQVQNAAFLAALSTKSTHAETIPEILGCAAAMRDHATEVNYPGELAEIVGTGGDNARSFNISTASALIAAAGGVRVAKHGNRAASSGCGTADCLEALGAQIRLSPRQCISLLDTVGFCFFFAPEYHVSMKYVASIRRELGIRTVFNILGPLTNPARPAVQLLGVYDETLVEPLASVLAGLGVRRGMVVYGKDRLDEISVGAPTLVCEINGDSRRTYTVTPEEFGFPTASREAVRGGTPAENAEILLRVLRGEQGPRRNIVLLNAGALLYLAGKAGSHQEGVRLAGEIIDSGTAAARLAAFTAASNR